MLHIVVSYIKYKGWHTDHPMRAKLIHAAKKYESHWDSASGPREKNAPGSLLDLLFDLKTFRENIIQGESSVFTLDEFDGISMKHWQLAEHLRVAFFKSSMIPLSNLERTEASDFRNSYIKSIADGMMSGKVATMSLEAYNLEYSKWVEIGKLRIPEVTHKLPPVPEKSRALSLLDELDIRPLHLRKSIPSVNDLLPGGMAEIRITQLTELPIWSEPWFEDPEIFIEAFHQANHWIGQIKFLKERQIELEIQNDPLICKGICISELVNILINTVLVMYYMKAK